MINVKFFRNSDNVINKVRASGHSGYAEAGSDIVCSSVSSLLLNALVGLKEVLKLPISEKRNDRDGFLEFSLPSSINAADLEKAMVLLNATFISLREVEKHYKKYLKMEEVKNV